jgi:hypothetical protein
MKDSEAKCSKYEKYERFDEKSFEDLESATKHLSDVTDGMFLRTKVDSFFVSLLNEGDETSDTSDLEDL